MARAAPTDPEDGATIPGSAFWSLMTRWGIDDATALRVIGQAPSSSGKRPRFTLTGEQVERYGFLRAIDEQLDALDQPPDWVRRKQRGAPYDGATPIARMAYGGLPAIREALSVLTKRAMQRALTGVAR